MNLTVTESCRLEETIKRLTGKHVTVWLNGAIGTRDCLSASNLRAIADILEPLKDCPQPPTWQDQQEAFWKEPGRPKFLYLGIGGVVET